jgi:hypothetical protein
MTLERVPYAYRLYTSRIWLPGSSAHRPEMEPVIPWQIVPPHPSPFIPFIIGDTEDHAALCGHYKSCTAGVAQLCQACKCPTMVCGYSKARDYARRKPKIFDKLVRKKKFLELKAMSEQYLNIAFDNVQLGMHNDHGIFGACPGEILHLILISWFRNVVDSVRIAKDNDV